MHLIELTRAERERDGTEPAIWWEILATPFGDALVACTDEGICHLAFADVVPASVASLAARFPRAILVRGSHRFHDAACSAFRRTGARVSVPLHVRGTPFQLRVWNALLRVPRGRTATYGDIAARIGHPKACRAVGTAVGNNPVAFLVPCHRVIPSSGGVGKYRWGTERKAAMIQWEQNQ